VVVVGGGGCSWRSSVSGTKSAPCRNFLDGDLIESFLDLRREKMDEVASAVGCTVPELCKRIETLAQAIH
jgi:DNA damage-binding protein 1